jgi:glycosyltransferase involved in cell wall biosynthesis
MRFSVVMPTHNRLHLLRDAIETVRRQDFADWELVVFDNASRDPIREHVQSLRDDRVRYDRSDEFLPVSSSWNEAIERARGDYVILLGDDDGLTPRYFTRVDAIIAKFGDPDVVYSNIYQFWHPGVAPWEPSGYLIDVRHGFFFKGRDEPFLLSEEQAKRAARDSIRLRISFSFNSQAVMYRRSFLRVLSADGPVYRSPFPDYYIANVALARSKSTVVIPQPIAVAGVSRASFGYTMYNSKEKEGAALLNTKLETDPVYRSIEQRLLPGPSYATNFVVAMEYVARALPELNERVDYRKYRRVQICAVFRAILCGEASRDLWLQVRERLSPWERTWASCVWFVLSRAARSGPMRKRVLAGLHKILSMSGSDPMVRHCGKHNFARVTELYDALSAGTLS